MWSTKLTRVYVRNLDVLPVKRYIPCPRGPRRIQFSVFTQNISIFKAKFSSTELRSFRISHKFRSTNHNHWYNHSSPGTRCLFFYRCDVCIIIIIITTIIMARHTDKKTNTAFLGCLCYNQGGELMGFPTVHSWSVVYFIKS